MASFSDIPGEISTNTILEEVESTPRDTFTIDFILKTAGSIAGFRDKMRFSDIGYDEFIYQVYLEQSANKIDILEIEMTNIDRINDQIFVQGNEIEMEIGYAETQVETYKTFIITNTEFDFKPTGSIVTLKCMGKGVFLSANEQRRKYYNVRHSDIARQIANFYALNPVVENTSEVFSEISQVNETDWCFLRSLAKLNGFLFFVENNELHFRKIQNGFLPRHNNNMVYTLGAENSYIYDLKLCVSSYGKNFNVEKQKIDLNSGQISNKIDGSAEIYKVDDIDPDPIDIESIKTFDISLERKGFVESTTLTESLSEIKKYLDSKRYFSEFLIKAKFRSVGVEKLRPRRILSLAGIDRFDGDYFVTKVCHSFTGEAGKNIGYQNKVECYKKFTAPPDLPFSFGGSVLDSFIENRSQFITNNNDSSGNVARKLGSA